MVACANGEAVEGTAESTPAAEGADLVIASRYQPGSIQKGVPPFRLLLSVGARVLFWWYLRMPGVRDYTCGFRGFRGDLIARGLDRFGAEGLITRSGFACTDELLVHLAMTGPVIREVPFELRYDRKIGESKMDIGFDGQGDDQAASGTSGRFAPRAQKWTITLRIVSREGRGVVMSTESAR